MHATKEERLAIGKRIHDGELTRSEASKAYGVPERTIRDWEAIYRESIGEKKPLKKNPNRVLSNERAAYENNELRAKKGYEVRGVGANKEFITSDEENSK